MKRHIIILLITFLYLPEYLEAQLKYYDATEFHCMVKPQRIQKIGISIHVLRLYSLRTPYSLMLCSTRK